MDTDITVRGTFKTSQPPERGVVHVSISYAGPSMEPVYGQVASDLDVTKRSLAELGAGDRPAVTWWSADQLRTWSDRPWNQDGEQLPLVHHAGVDLEVKFRDFSALAAWVRERVTTAEGFRVTHIKWALTAGRHDELIRDVRRGAVHDALDRAQLYADALGLGQVRPIAIADVGMLTSGSEPDGDHRQIHMVARAELGLGQAGHGPDVELVPRDIEVTASVDVRFVAESTGAPQHLEVELVDDESDAHQSLMSVSEYRDDNDGYLNWLSAHPDGFVINILRTFSRNQARLHHAACWTIGPGNIDRNVLTSQYVKICADRLEDLDQWATRHVGQHIVRCGTCRPRGLSAEAEPAARGPLPVAASALAVSNCIDGPGSDAVVGAWADDYIRFENLPVWQKNLRNEIRERCRQLVPAADQVLHATFFGAKHIRADVENVLLYYIDSFRSAGRNGIRFEHGSGVLQGSDQRDYRYAYRYALAPRSGTFHHWQQGPMLAKFDWTDLGSFAGDKKLGQVWLALSRGKIEVNKRKDLATPFAVQLEISPPRNRQPVWGGLLKGVFDGAISALQAHANPDNLTEIANRLAAELPVDSVEIERLLLDQDCAALGVADELASLYGNGVKWDPCDHLCVAGELLAADPSAAGDDENWAIKGEVFEVYR